MTGPEAVRGTARDALRQPDFRRFFLAALVSNSGRWMQSIAQGVLAWELTESPAFLGIMVFAGLGPMGLLGLVGGSLADTADRRKLLLFTQTWQMFWSFVLAALVLDGDIDPKLLVAIVFITALGQGIYAPTFTSVLPLLAGEGNLGAAISLNSSQSQLSRVIGPSLGGLATAWLGFSAAFAINGLTYLAVLAAIWVTRFPDSTSTPSNLSDRLFGGFRIAKRAPQVGRPLATMCLFSLFCLPFIGQLPAIAELNLNVDASSVEYGWFYAMFGVGAFTGALLSATVFNRSDRARIARITLAGFSASLAWLTTVDSLIEALPAILLVGLFYFTLPVSLSTMWQEHVDNAVRGRVAAIWIMSFAGMVPISNMIAGYVVELTSLRAVLLFGAAAALALSITVRFKPGEIVGEELLGR